MSLRKILSVLIICFLISPAVKAGDIKKIRGEAERFSPESESPEIARKKVIQEAQINALEKAFGTALTERTMNISETREGHTSNISRSSGESLINGDWIRNLTSPEITKVPVDNGTMYYAKVYGEAREMKYNRIDVDCWLLCNGTDPDKDRLRGDIFYEGDELYVYFISPVDGWLAIYLIDDDNEHTTQRLVPYDDQKEVAYPIVANREYIFFSKKTAEPQYVDFVTRMIVEARKKVDINDLYIIFSPNEFKQVPTTVYKHSRHNTVETDIQSELMPRETTYQKFDEWMCKQRRKDADLQPIPISFSIRRKTI